LRCVLSRVLTSVLSDTSCVIAYAEYGLLRTIFPCSLLPRNRRSFCAGGPKLLWPCAIDVMESFLFLAYVTLLPTHFQPYYLCASPHLSFFFFAERYPQLFFFGERSQGPQPPPPFVLFTFFPIPADLSKPFPFLGP